MIPAQNPCTQNLTITPIDATETMRMVQKGQLRYAGKNVCAQNKLINKIFGLAA